MPTRRLLLAATALAAAAMSSPAAAQRIDTIVAFGDSYADQDNAFQLGLVPPAIQPLYPTRRFTGGSNYIDTLSQLLDAPVFNFAIGGARANPDFLFEISSFASGGGGPAFPTVTPTFDEGDLVTVSIGGNDARAYGSTPGASVAGAPAAAAPAVAAAETGLDALVAAGAPTISFLAGDTGRLPEVAANPSVAAIRSAFSTAFNTGMQDVLAGYAADGVIVHYLDLTAMLDRVQANLAAYGFTSAGACTPLALCVTDANHANQFVFYVDALHPTSRTSALIAQYIAAQLQAPLTLKGPSELGVETARQFGRTLSSRIDLTPPRDGDFAEGMKLFLVGDSFSRDVDADDSTDAFDVDGTGLTAGLSYGFGNGIVGLAANYSKPRAKFGSDVSRTESDTWQVGAFAGYTLAGAFAQAYLGYGRDELDVERAAIIDSLEAETDGSHWLAGLKAGYLMPVGIMRAGPVVALDYAKAKVDGYTEQGDAVLALNVGSVSAKSLTGAIGAELRGDFEGGGVQLRPFAAAMLEKELSGDDRTVTFAQTSAPGIVNSWTIEERTDKAYGRLSGGGSAAILQRVTLNALVSSTLGKDDGDDVSAQLGLHVGF